MTSPIAGTTGTSPGTAGSAASSALGSVDQNTFLKLLVAQMKYQNPSSPMDPAAFMSQMAQFSTVEKLGSIEASQTQVASWQRALAGEGMIGKTISAHDTTPGAAADATVTGVVTGLKLTDVGPRLTLADGSTVAVDDVLTVAPTTTPSTPAAPASP